MTKKSCCQYISIIIFALNNAIFYGKFIIMYA